VSLPKNFAAFALMSVRNAEMSVVSTNMTIVRNAQKPVISVQSNAERWQHKLYQHKNPLRRVFLLAIGNIKTS